MEPALPMVYVHRENCVQSNLAPKQLTDLASHLIYEGLLPFEIASEALQKSRTQEIPFSAYLVQNKILSSAVIFNSISQFNFPIANLEKIDRVIFNDSLLTHEIIHKYHVIPLRKLNQSLHVAISDPTDQLTINAIRFYSGLGVTVHIAPEDDIVKTINMHLGNPLHKNLESQLLKELSLEEIHFTVHENTVNYDEPIIYLVNHLIEHALQQSVSDIHIEPYETICRIRYRKDGILYQFAEFPIPLSTRIATRLKVMAQLDITERRLPQDGRFQFQQLDVRINFCPTLFGEKIVLRLLDTKKISLNIDELGFLDTQKAIFLDKISQPQGLILVTGPTGSGKTITLYSALTHLNTLEKNISTVEDPVEIQLAGINQVHVNPKINLHFSAVLKTFLRQDPDIIMVGEIRDPETAEIAIQAAQTGHLVLTTLHTNSAIETLVRLQSIGVAPYNIINSITLIAAQRLIRKLCAHCKIPDNFSASFRAAGCEHCLQGYDGRIGIYELLVMTDQLRQLIMDRADHFCLLEQAKRDGFVSLYEMGEYNVKSGITSLAELNRVLSK